MVTERTSTRIWPICIAARAPKASATKWAASAYVLSHGYYDAYYLQAQKVRRLIAQDLSRAFERCDVILGPTAPTTAFEIGAKAEDPCRCTSAISSLFRRRSQGFQRCRFPAASMPLGCLGLQLMDGIFPKLLLRAAHRYQQATDWHLRVPTETPL